jgi:hypothetical protein
MRKLFTILIVVLSTQFSFNLSAQCIEGNCVNGQGTYAWADGDQYSGEYKDGKKHGQGTYNHASGAQYSGEWKDDKKHGQGTDNYANGNQYIGEWKDGKYHGQGTYNYASGSQYSGEWKDGKYHGQGTYKHPNFTSKKGIWENDVYIGTVAEVERKRKEEAERKEAARQIRLEAEKKAKTIYNACILDKSSDVDMTVTTIRRAVEETCEEISEDPSFFESWKYE